MRGPARGRERGIDDTVWPRGFVPLAPPAADIVRGLAVWGMRVEEPLAVEVIGA
jgi:hypothetical protein